MGQFDKQKKQLMPVAVRHCMAEARYYFTLYIAGSTGKSAATLEKINRFSTAPLNRFFRIQVVDLQKQPYLAHDKEIVATPTLVRRSPLPSTKVIGHVALQRFLVGLARQARDAEVKRLVQQNRQHMAESAKLLKDSQNFVAKVNGLLSFASSCGKRRER
jgi:circadian clock protein KaiB